jgi:RNA polymerase sigma-70 factor (sigma-E family)
MRRDQREQEFSEFFSAHGPALRRTAYLVVRDWHTAEDVTQQALAKVYAAWSRIRPETRMAYARRAVVNESLSLLRRHRPETPTQHLPEDPVDDHAPGLDLGRLLDLLPPRQRAIVALRFLDDLPVSEVGRLLGVADGTVKSQTARALDTLRTHLPELTTTEEHR